MGRRRPPAPRPRVPKVCGALVQNAPYGRVDACGEEQGHDQSLSPTPHRGMYRGMVWETYWDKATGKKRSNIIHQGDAFDEERLEGGVPVREVRRHTIHGTGAPHVAPPASPRSRPTP